MFSFSEYADTIPRKVQRGLFIFAVANSCVNPILYGEVMLQTFLAVKILNM